MKTPAEIELAQIRRQMRGINPKLSIYQKLKAQEQALMERMGTWGRAARYQPIEDPNKASYLGKVEELYRDGVTRAKGIAAVIGLDIDRVEAMMKVLKNNGRI